MRLAPLALVLLSAAVEGTVPAQPAPLTLADALRLAGERNETPRIARARIARAAAVRREAYGALLPSVTLTGTYTRRAREVERTLQDETVTIQAQDALDGAAIAEVDVFDASNLPFLRRAARLLEAERLDAVELSRGLAFEVAESFFAVLGAEELEAAARTRVEVADRTLADARQRLQAGLAARNEVTRSELELASASLARTTAANLVRTSRLALGTLIAEPVEGPLAGQAASTRLAPPPDTEGAEEPEPHAWPEGALEDLERRAVTGRSDVAALARRAEAAGLAARGTRLELVPSLRLRGTWTATNEAGLSGETSNWNVAALLSWSLYDGGVRLARAAALEAERREIELEAGALTRRVGQDVRLAASDLETAEAAVREAALARRVARENAEEVAELFAQGLATALEQADANVSEFEASAELARQGFALQVARLALEEAVGDWPEGSDPLRRAVETEGS